jgi:hypothetical protein
VIVCWPQTTTNFSLEVATALKAPIPWYPAPDIATLADGQFLVTNNSAAAARFYRLATWDTLFDGTSTAAFTGYQQTNFPGTNQWIVTTNRELMTVSNAAPRDISTREQFGDFELFWEWRPIAPTNGNGGVFYRVGDTNLPAYRSGPEYQLYDDARGILTDERQRIGAVYGLIGPTNKVLVPTGEWNHCFLLVQSNPVQHYLNGHQVVDYQFRTARWTNAIQNGTIEVQTNFSLGAVSAGYIVLQHHGQSVLYRNIKVRRLQPQ